ncbi:MAG: Rrf2 family transcriptional regulator [Actinomycetota bacterium]
MRFSLRAQRALRLAGWLAVESTESLLSLESLAVREGISRIWVEQVMTDLRRAGIVASRRGARGGYQLARRPEEVTLGEVLRAVGEQPQIDLCAPDSEGRCCCPGLVCVTHEAWERVQGALSGVLEETTLASLCQDGLARRKDAATPVTFLTSPAKSAPRMKRGGTRARAT